MAATTAHTDGSGEVLIDEIRDLASAFRRLNARIEALEAQQDRADRELAELRAALARLIAARGGTDGR